MTLWETLADSGGDQINVLGHPRHVVGYLRDFLFQAKQARSPVSSLSGGEKNRLLLAKYLARPSNLMVLDEPTNDLDMETLDLLQEMLADYKGTIILVSHDRDFIDRVVTSTIVFEEAGNITEYSGGYTDYMHQKKESNNFILEESKRQNKTDSFIFDKHKKSPLNRMSYKDRQELEFLPTKIKELEMEIAKLNELLSNSRLSVSELRELSIELDSKSKSLAQSEERWIELELLKEG